MCDLKDSDKRGPKIALTGIEGDSTCKLLRPNTLLYWVFRFQQKIEEKYLS